MKTFFYLISLLLFVYLNSCTSKEKEIQIMKMDGDVENVFNSKNISCNKGDTILVSTCGARSKFITQVYGIYAGVVPKLEVWYNEDGSVKSSCVFEKVVFLKDVQ